MVCPAAPLLEEPKNLCAPKVQPVPVLASRREQSLAGTGGEGRDWCRSPVSATPCLLSLGCRDTFQVPGGGYRAAIILLFGGWRQ